MTAHVYFLLCCTYALTCRADSVCSLVVHVSDSRGASIGIDVVVTDSTGRQVTKQSSASGTTFCDLGVLPVSVSVGAVCNRVTVTDVTLSRNRTRYLRIIHDRCPDDDADSAPMSGCAMIVFIRNTSGVPIPSAFANLVEPHTRQIRADRFGRIAYFAPENTRIIMNINAPGFAEGVLDTACSRATPNIERAIVLTVRR